VEKANETDPKKRVLSKVGKIQNIQMSRVYDKKDDGNLFLHARTEINWVSAIKELYIRWTNED
jgi:hypothetical protein